MRDPREKLSGVVVYKGNLQVGKL